MLKKIISISTLFIVTTIHAETCPSIADIKSGIFHQWQVLDIDNAEPVTGENLTEFENAVATFALTQWLPDAPEGSGQCFYYGINHDSDYLGVYLAKPTSGPNLDVGNWREISFDVMQCDANILLCQFKINV